MQTGPGDSLGIRWYADSEVQDVYPLVTQRREKWNDDCPISLFYFFAFSRPLLGVTPVPRAVAVRGLTGRAGPSGRWRQGRRRWPPGGGRAGPPRRCSCRRDMGSPSMAAAAGGLR